MRRDASGCVGMRLDASGCMYNSAAFVYMSCEDGLRLRGRKRRCYTRVLDGGGAAFVYMSCEDGLRLRGRKRRCYKRVLDGWGRETRGLQAVSQALKLGSDIGLQAARIARLIAHSPSPLDCNNMGDGKHAC
jgi:hypothetical protein